MTEEKQREGVLRDQAEAATAKRVNEACCKEWDLRLKAKKYLAMIKQNTHKHAQKVLQDGVEEPIPGGYYDKAKHNPYGRKGIYNHAYLVKNES